MTKRRTYVVFVPWPAGEIKRATKVWWVRSTSGAHLGMVSWRGQWRCYTFSPAYDTVFNAGCMSDIAAFCTHETGEHMRLRKIAKLEATQS